MNKKPLIFLNEIKSTKQHNKTVCYVSEKEKIEEQINQIFQGNEPLYMKKVLIETKTNTFETRIYEKREKELITLDRKIIPIDTIKKIERIS